MAEREKLTAERCVATIAKILLDLLAPTGDTPYLRAELIWSISHEAVIHLDDMLLRCFRFGILLQDGGQSLLPHLKPVMQQEWGCRKDEGSTLSNPHHLSNPPHHRIQ